MNKWNILYKELASQHEYIKLNPPATQKQLIDVEETLNLRLPSDIKELLTEINGDGWFIFSTDQIIETNLTVRKLDCYMPLDCILFFAGNGCGDYFGYPITYEDGVRDDNVFMWEHENDSRIWKANSLEDAIRKYYNSEI